MLLILQFRKLYILDDKVPHPLVKHRSSEELMSRYPAEDGKQAGLTSSFNSKGLSNLRITKSLSNVLGLYVNPEFVFQTSEAMFLT